MVCKAETKKQPTVKVRKMRDSDIMQVFSLIKEAAQEG